SPHRSFVLMTRPEDEEDYEHCKRTAGFYRIGIKDRIFICRNSFESKESLAQVLVHETLHAIFDSADDCPVTMLEAQIGILSGHYPRYQGEYAVNCGLVESIGEF